MDKKFTKDEEEIEELRVNNTTADERRNAIENIEENEKKNIKPDGKTANWNK
ncbi:hypothetical protein SAMN04488589_0992 [Methanolobus vulcani]|jgi:hypothetical protein|uniref:Uncharacterized protein n=1 Tax=Methanolobus vulcani TaxID=38026 RepID=A0A7Z7AVM3_9EURY|nr:hypothetical protein [Methanolobus vulcani]MDK2825731.1 hypothetical protein [Methanolobus sp.]MDK2947708.1 hypothetical protein [Methanolobus sp.]SDF64328.1 hypothetical protein SAMN04488589_0992 [Methanolobus vulcani]